MVGYRFYEGEHGKKGSLSRVKGRMGMLRGREEYTEGEEQKKGKENQG